MTWRSVVTESQLSSLRQRERCAALVRLLLGTRWRKAVKHGLARWKVLEDGLDGWPSCS